MGVKSRLLLVSNRLPATVRVEGGAVEIRASTGGLATGLAGPHRELGGLWFGWPGDLRGAAGDTQSAIGAELERMRLVPIRLSREEIEGYYHGFANGVLWPLFHYLLDRLPLDARQWQAYRHANERFADEVAERARPDDLIWVHDYQLALVPALLRERLPRARIGFFLHIPFPTSEVFRILPWREEILRGMLGADRIGFHTLSYLRHFSTSALRILGIEAQVDRMPYEGREVLLGVHPMGVDARAFERFAADPQVAARAEELRHEAGDARLVVGIDRLDYTKGIPRRLLAIERLLEREPELAGRVRMVQIAAPSRVEVRAYEDFKRRVDELVGRINGRFGTASWVPIHCIARSFEQRELAAYYLAADVLTVTPLRDGMNLVAKEFVATRSDLDGVLVLSEFTGAAAELPEALLVNPYDIEGLSQTLRRALDMPRDERRTRLEAMRARVAENDVHAWAAGFLEELERVKPPAGGDAGGVPRALRARILAELSSPRHASLLLDYDGTLVPLAPHPSQAAPGAGLRALLGRLAARNDISVHVVSGRVRADMEAWLGDIAVHLHAEHGLWTRPRGASEWRCNAAVGAGWKVRVRPILEAFVRAAPGSFVEEKTAGLAWHYRRVEHEVAAQQAKELRLHLMEILSNSPVEVLAGDRVVEIRAQGVHKGLVVPFASARATGAFVLAIGDDATDEDLFAALPEDAVALKVGDGPTRAAGRLRSSREVRALLEELLAARTAGGR